MSMKKLKGETGKKVVKGCGCGEPVMFLKEEGFEIRRLMCKLHAALDDVLALLKGMKDK